MSCTPMHTQSGGYKVEVLPRSSQVVLNFESQVELNSFHYTSHIVIARIRCVREGNVFTHVCQSV